MVNYALGKIYRIVSPSTPGVYIGSTCSPLKKRWREHKAQFKQYTSGRGGNYMSSYSIIASGDARLELIEEYPCDSGEELRMIERFHVETEPNCVNKRVPGRTAAEAIAAFPEKHRDAQKRYAQTYYGVKIACECGTIISSGNAKHFASQKHQRLMNARAPLGEPIAA